MDLARAERFLSRFAIKDRDSHKQVPFVLNYNQKRIHEVARQQQLQGKPIRIVVDKARRVGVSSWAEGLGFAHCCWLPGSHFLIAAHEFKSSKALFSIPKGFARQANFLNLRDVEREITFPHESADALMQIVTAGKDTSGRGFTLSGLHLSEAAHYKGVGEIFTSVIPAVSNHKDTIIIIESTPNGMDGDGETFYEMWLDAIHNRSEYAPVFLSWIDDPACTADPSLAKNAPIDKEEKLLLKRGLTKAQLAWRRLKIASPECGGLVELFHQEFPCLCAGTKISYNGGIIPIEKAGQVVGFNCESGKITNWQCNPPTEVYKLTTKYGRELRGTGHHPVHGPSGFTNLSELKPNQPITLRSPIFSDGPGKHQWQPIPSVLAEMWMDENWARFIGYFMGDGSFWGGTLSLCGEGKDLDVAEDCSRLIKTIFSQEPHQRQVRGAFEFRQHMPDLRGLLASLQLIKQSRNSTAQWVRWIHVPACIWRATKSCVQEFLRGLFETDGSASANIVRMGTQYLPFAREVQLLLLGFGINAEIRPEKRCAQGKQFMCYALYMYREAAVLFHERVGFIGKRKRNAFKRIGKLGRPPKKHELIDYVESVVYDGLAVTYDLTVKPDHVFSANGILTHNTTWEESFISSGFPAFEEAERQWAAANVKKPKWQGFIDHTDDGSLKLRQHAKGDYCVWKDQIDGHHYYMGSDAARGDDDKDGRDFAATVIFDGNTGEQCARFSGFVVPEIHGCYINSLGRHYNKAMSNGELTGGYGYGTLYVLRDLLHYPNLYRWKGKDDKVGSWASGRNAVWYETTMHTRTMLFELMRAALREGAGTSGDYGVTIYDELLSAQVRMCTRKETGRVDVKKGHDDILFGAMLANVGMRQWAPPRTMNVIKSQAREEDEEVRKLLGAKGDQVLDEASMSLINHIKKMQGKIDAGQYAEDSEFDEIGVS